MSDETPVRHVMVRYKLKPDRVAENQAKIEAVFEALRELRPGGLHYAVYKLPDGVSFVHLATTIGSPILPSMPAFQEFTRDIAERCEEPPAPTDLTPVAAYDPTTGGARRRLRGRARAAAREEHEE